MVHEAPNGKSPSPGQVFEGLSRQSSFDHRWGGGLGSPGVEDFITFEGSPKKTAVDQSAGSASPSIDDLLSEENLEPLLREEDEAKHNSHVLATDLVAAKKDETAALTTDGIIAKATKQAIVEVTTESTKAMESKENSATDQASMGAGSASSVSSNAEGETKNATDAARKASKASNASNRKGRKSNSEASTKKKSSGKKRSSTEGPAQERKRAAAAAPEGQGDSPPAPGGLLDLLCTVSVDFGDRLEVGCKCTRTRCLKLYCDCFQSGKVCIATCSCVSCSNTAAESGPNGLRTKAIHDVLKRRPDAFEKRVKNVDAGCRCKNSKCLKKYCVCFNNGKKCMMRCRCINCQNIPEAGQSLAVRQMTESQATSLAASMYTAETQATSLAASMYTAETFEEESDSKASVPQDAPATDFACV